ncbi:MAG: phosphatase PAP2 family protein [Solobacterium sp.]|nr:phosphatase PAP2 family protein [Solobacterium sp.]
MKIDKKYITGLALFVLFIIWTILVKVVDVAPIGPQNTEVGFSTINGAIHELFGLNMFWYKLTMAFGILAIACAGVFAVIGLVQLIQRKSLNKVDHKLIAAGVLYLLIIILYVLFEKLVINYRPVIMPDNTVPEASYPSSHVMVICVILGSVPYLIKDYLRNADLTRIVSIVCYVIMGLTVIGRLLSGVHWFTDIIGGVLISASFLLIFAAVSHRLDVLKRRRNRRRHKA